MREKTNISDELLVKFLNSDTTKEESEQVLNYLSENDENLEDFICMAAALESHWDEERIRKTLRLRTRRRVLWWTSAAAAVIVLLIVGTFIIRNNGQQQENLIAQQEQTEIPEENGSQESAVEVDSTLENGTSERQEIQQYTPKKEEPKLYADSSHKQYYATMIYPSKEVTTVNQKRSITFRWNSDAENIHLEITSGENAVLVNEDLGKSKWYHLQTTDTTTTYHWKISFNYSNKTSIVKQGKITNTFQ